MAFVQVGGVPIVKLDAYEAGEVIIEGVYLGSFETKFNNPAFKFLEKNGTIRAVACGSMRYKMKEVEKGMKVRIIYLGKDVMTKGQFNGRPFHDVQVLVDDPSIDGSALDSDNEDEGGVF